MHCIIVSLQNTTTSPMIAILFVFASPGSVVAALGIETHANVQSDLTETLVRFTGSDNMMIASESTVVTASPSTTGMPYLTNLAH